MSVCMIQVQAAETKMCKTECNGERRHKIPWVLKQNYQIFIFFIIMWINMRHDVDEKIKNIRVCSQLDSLEIFLYHPTTF